MGMRIVTSFRIVIALILPCSYFTQENICPTTSGEKVVHVCEGNFATGTSVYLDTFKAVNYEGGCTCQLRAQGGAVDLQVSVQGVHAACDATLYFAAPIDHTYNCADKTPATTTGRIESGESVFLSLTKSSDVADFCVHLVQTSTAGSLNVACTKGMLKPASTTTIAPASAVTTSPTTITENICPTTSGEKVVHVCEGNFATGTSVYLDTFKAVNYEGGCTCQLRAQGGAVDLQVSVQGVHAACDATVYFAPPIDHTYNCADKTPATTTGRIESGQSVFLSLTKSSDVADFCVHLVQTSTAGSLNVACTKGMLKPASTTTIAPAPAVTTSPTTITENICPTTSGEKVVHVCEGNFATGTSVYLDTFKAVNYEGGCTCQLRAQGGAVDLQVSVQGVHAACDATLYFAAPIDHTYNCADKTPATTTGRIESGQSVFLSLTKSTDVADFCVHLVQTSTAGSLNVACTKGTLKPASTTTIAPAPAPAVTTSPTTIIENICPTASGEKVVHVCEGNFATGTSVYLDTFKAVNYEGGCTCQLRAQGGAVDLQVSVQGVHAACDATLYLAAPIDHTYNCADKTPATTTGRIESGQSVFLSLTKSSDVADFCVHLVQTSTAGSLNVACTKGTLKPASTTTIAPAPAVTTSPTTSIENICPTTSGEKVVHVCEGNFATGTSVYLDTFKAVNYEGGCTCQLRAQGGAVDLQVSVQGVHAACDATLYFAAPIDHTYNCADKTPATTTGRIESGQSVFLSLTKSSDVADFCVHLVQTSTAGSLNVACTKGTLKPASTTTIAPAPAPAVTTSPTTIIENICPTTSGEKVVHVCEGNFATGTSVYLDTFKAVNYEGVCTCQLRAQGGAVDFQVSVQGVHAACDATLYFAAPIDHTYNCADKTPATTTGRIESGQSVFLSLTKSSDVADFCVNLVQTSTAGSLNLVCSSGILKSTSPPATTSSPTNSPNNVATTLTTSVTESKGSSSENPDNTVTESKGSSSESPDNTVTESKGSSSEKPDNTVTESKGSSSENPDNTVTESKDSSSENPDNTVTESKGSSTESPNITPSGNTGLNTAETPQSVIVVSFVVVGVFAAIVVVMILFGVFTYCRDKSRLGKLRAAQNLPNGHTNV